MSITRKLNEATRAAGDVAVTCAKGGNFSEAGEWTKLAIDIDALFHRAIKLQAAARQPGAAG